MRGQDDPPSDAVTDRTPPRLHLGIRTELARPVGVRFRRSAGPALLPSPPHVDQAHQQHDGQSQYRPRRRLHDGPDGRVPRAGRGGNGQLRRSRLVPPRRAVDAPASGAARRDAVRRRRRVVQRARGGRRPRPATLDGLILGRLAVAPGPGLHVQEGAEVPPRRGARQGERAGGGARADRQQRHGAPSDGGDAGARADAGPRRDRVGEAVAVPAGHARREADPDGVRPDGEFRERAGLTGPRTYGTVYGMSKPRKTTIYLPESLKRDVERVAESERRSEADVIRDAVEASIAARRPPEPRIPLVSWGLGAPDIAERAEELLDGFGR